MRNEFNKIKEEHPDVLEKISQFPTRTKTAKVSKEQNTVVLRKKGMALFSIMAKYDSDKIVITEKTFIELFNLVKCSFEEQRLPLSKQFWIAYEKIKDYKPQFKSGRSEISLEKKAANSLKTLLKQKQDELDQPLISFIDTLLKDIKRYKTLPKYTLRKLVMHETSDKESYVELINNIENLKRKIGSDYLDIILERTSAIDEDIIIAVENRLIKEYSAQQRL